MRISVRKAKISDIDWILKELKAFADSYGTKKSLFGPAEHGKAIIQGLIKNHIFLVAESGEKLVGLISGYVVPHHFNPEIKMLVETFWWVTPEHRGSSAGARLLSAFEDYGKANADWISMTLESESSVSDKALLRRGYILKEKTFLMEVA